MSGLTHPRDIRQEPSLAVGLRPSCKAARSRRISRSVLDWLWERRRRDVGLPRKNRSQEAEMAFNPFSRGGEMASIPRRHFQSSDSSRGASERSQSWTPAH